MIPFQQKGRMAMSAINQRTKDKVNGGSSLTNNLDTIKFPLQNIVAIINNRYGNTFMNTPRLSIFDTFQDSLPE
jgi:hypothetical protein